jgi:uncharacterized membrane protein
VPPFAVFIHLVTVVPAAMIGAYLIVARKGSPSHRRLGKTYMLLMGFTAIWTLFLPAEFGPRLWNHFGMLHLLSLLTAWTVPTAWRAARRGDVRGHRNAMIQLYLGGILIAGTFAILGNGRYLNVLIFGS